MTKHVYLIEEGKVKNKAGKVIALINDNNILDRIGSVRGYYIDNKIFNSSGGEIAHVHGHNIFDNNNNVVGNYDDAKKLIDNKTITDMALAAIWLLYFLG